MSNKTLYQYSSYLEEVLFSFILRKFYFSQKKSLLSMPKIYVNDVGICYNYSEFSENIGRLMENLVFLELKKLELENILEIYYWKDYQQREVDFVVREGLKVRELIQVCYDIEDFSTKNRELKALIKAGKELKCKNLRVISWDYEGEEEFKGRKIEFTPLWKWLLGI